MKDKLLFLLLSVFLALSASVSAEEVSEISGKYANAEIYTQQINDNAISFLAEVKVKEGWHIYGPEKQDFGTPLSVGIIPNAQIKETQRISRTKKFIYDDIIEQHGYDDSFFVNATFVPRENTDYQLKLSYMACSDSCEEESLILDIPNKKFADKKLWHEKILEAEKTFGEEKKFVLSFFSAVIFAFFAGIILNFMPCIFPILSIKAIYMAQNRKETAKANYFGAFTYCAGVVLSFFIIATILYFLRKSGESAGWGFQLQSPWFVGIMLVLFIVIFLMFMDIVVFPQGKFHKLSQGNSFFTGFFAVLIASPCSGPFMGMVIGYALLQPLYLYYPIFISLAIGYALPFSLTDVFPQTVAKILPKSGKWMLWLKRILAVPVFCTILWLAWILSLQIKFSENERDNLWQNYSEEVLEDAISQGKPVFINFTAKWCLTCLLNENSTFKTADFIRRMKEKGAILMVADWTNKDEEIFQALERYQRSSVPLYVYYFEDGNYKILPQILTPNTVDKYINR